MLKILVIGAHPDDADVGAGGTAALWMRRGDQVAFISTTNGAAGHHELGARELEARRRDEARKAGEVLGISYEVLDAPDGHLEPGLERRLDLIRRIRSFSPDLILTHRPNDYHPDHRSTATLVHDSAYMVMVPLVCPDTPPLKKNPVIAYFSDEFTKPCPFTPDVVVDVDPVMESKWAMLDAHASQFYEWLPHVEGLQEALPTEPEPRRRWLEKHWGPRFQAVAHRYRDHLAHNYGADHAADVEHAEAFEVSEYGGRPSRAALCDLFPLR
jgi:LmbE family N-acetylglucosaminyl deacetylase